MVVGWCVEGVGSKVGSSGRRRRRKDDAWVKKTRTHQRGVVGKNADLGGWGIEAVTAQKKFRGGGIS